MIRQIFIFGCFCLSLHSLQAQDRFSFSVNAGTAIPVGEIAQRDIYNSASAFAKPGGSIDISAVYKFSKYFGIGLLWGAQQNSSDLNDISNELSNLSGYKVNLESGKWKMFRLMLGLNFEKPIDKRNKLLVTGRVLAGASSVQTPYQWLNQDLKFPNGSTGTEGSLLSLSGQYPYRFTGQLGAGMKYYIQKKIFINLNIDYIFSTARYYASHYPITDGQQFYQVNTLAEPLLPVDGYAPFYVTRSNNFVNATLGVGVQF
jgi:hypothetical protein